MNMNDLKLTKFWLNAIPSELIERLVANAIRKLNLVSREEFEVQTKVLQRTRQKLEQLEQQLASLSRDLA